MPAINHLFQRAIALSKAEKKDDARRLLSYILQQQPNNQAAWLWYADTFESPAERKAVLQKVLQINPSNRYARGALARLDSTAAMPAPVSVVAQPTKAVLITAQAPRRGKVSARTGRSLLAFLSIVVGIGLCLGVVYVLGVAQYERLSQEHQALASQHTTLQGEYASLQQRAQALSAAYQALSSQHDDLTTQHQDLSSQYQDLWGRYTGLSSQYQDLTTQHQDLSKQFQDLSSRHQDLTTRYQDLSGQYDGLLAQYQDLSTRYNGLTGEFQDLSNRYNGLTRQYQDLSSNYQVASGQIQELKKQIDQAVLPPYIRIHDRKVEVAFYRLDQRPIYWIMPFESLEGAISRGNLLRFFPPKTWLKQDDGSLSKVIDFRKFTNPKDLNLVSSTMYGEINDPETFLRQAWYMVAQLSHWTEEEGEIPRTPLETLLAGGGDCEDLAILFASLVKAAPVDWKVDLVLIDTNNLHNPVKLNHVIVSVRYGQRQYLVETTSTKEMEPYTQGVKGYYLEVK